jgi:hypothetical protein
MASHIRDTVSIQQDTVTLSGYSEIWSVADAHHTPKSHLHQKLKAMTRAAENYTWVAQDLPNLRPVSQTRSSLLTLLIYYLRGMRYAVRSASTRGNNQKLTNVRNELSVQLDVLEESIRLADTDNQLASLPQANLFSFV